MMKSIGFTIVAGLSLVLTGCDNEDDAASANVQNGGGKCVLENVHFDVNGMQIYTSRSNAPGGVGDGCNSKGSCAIAKGDEMISSTPPSYPPNSNAIVHSLTGDLRKHNGEEVTIIQHDANASTPRVQVKENKSKKLLWVNVAYLRPVLHISQQVRVTSWSEQQAVASSTSSFVQDTALIQRDELDVEKSHDKEDQQDKLAAENIISAAHAVASALTNLLPSRIPMSAFPESAEIYEDSEGEEHVHEHDISESELRAAEETRRHIAREMEREMERAARRESEYRRVPTPVYHSPSYTHESELHPHTSNHHEAEESSISHHTHHPTVTEEVPVSSPTEEHLSERVSSESANDNMQLQIIQAELCAFFPGFNDDIAESGLVQVRMEDVDEEVASSESVFDHGVLEEVNPEEDEELVPSVDHHGLLPPFDEIPLLQYDHEANVHMARGQFRQLKRLLQIRGLRTDFDMIIEAIRMRMLLTDRKYFIEEFIAYVQTEDSSFVEIQGVGSMCHLTARQNEIISRIINMQFHWSHLNNSAFVHNQFREFIKPARSLFPDYNVESLLQEPVTPQTTHEFSDKFAENLLGGEEGEFGDSWLLAKLRTRHLVRFANADLLVHDSSILQKLDESMTVKYKLFLVKYLSDATPVEFGYEECWQVVVKIISKTQKLFPWLLGQALSPLQELVSRASDALMQQPRLLDLLGGKDAFITRWEESAESLKALLIVEESRVVFTQSAFWQSTEHWRRFEGALRAIENTPQQVYGTFLPVDEIDDFLMENISGVNHQCLVGVFRKDMEKILKFSYTDGALANVLHHVRLLMNKERLESMEEGLIHNLLTSEIIKPDADFDALNHAESNSDYTQHDTPTLHGQNVSHDAEVSEEANPESQEPLEDVTLPGENLDGTSSNDWLQLDQIRTEVHAFYGPDLDEVSAFLQIQANDEITTVAPSLFETPEHCKQASLRIAKQQLDQLKVLLEANGSRRDFDLTIAALRSRMLLTERRRFLQGFLGHVQYHHIKQTQPTDDQALIADSVKQINTFSSMIIEKCEGIDTLLMDHTLSLHTHSIVDFVAGGAQLSVRREHNQKQRELLKNKLRGIIAEAAPYIGSIDDRKWLTLRHVLRFAHADFLVAENSVIAGISPAFAALYDEFLQKYIKDEIACTEEVSLSLSAKFISEAKDAFHVILRGKLRPVGFLVERAEKALQQQPRLLEYLGGESKFKQSRAEAYESVREKFSGIPMELGFSWNEFLSSMDAWSEFQALTRAPQMCSDDEKLVLFYAENIDRPDSQMGSFQFQITDAFEEHLRRENGQLAVLLHKVQAALGNLDDIEQTLVRKLKEQFSEIISFPETSEESIELDLVDYEHAPDRARLTNIEQELMIFFPGISFEDKKIKEAEAVVIDADSYTLEANMAIVSKQVAGLKQNLQAKCPRAEFDVIIASLRERMLLTERRDFLDEFASEEFAKPSDHGFDQTEFASFMRRVSEQKEVIESVLMKGYGQGEQTIMHAFGDLLKSSIFKENCKYPLCDLLNFSHQMFPDYAFEFSNLDCKDKPWMPRSWEYSDSEVEKIVMKYIGISYARFRIAVRHVVRFINADIFVQKSSVLQDCPKEVVQNYKNRLEEYSQDRSGGHLVLVGKVFGDARRKYFPKLVHRELAPLRELVKNAREELNRQPGIMELLGGFHQLKSRDSEYKDVMKQRFPTDNYATRLQFDLGFVLTHYKNEGIDMDDMVDVLNVFTDIDRFAHQTWDGDHDHAAEVADFTEQIFGKLWIISRMVSDVFVRAETNGTFCHIITGIPHLIGEFSVFQRSVVSDIMFKFRDRIVGGKFLDKESVNDKRQYELIERDVHIVWPKDTPGTEHLLAEHQLAHAWLTIAESLLASNGFREEFDNTVASLRARISLTERREFLIMYQRFDEEEVNGAFGVVSEQLAEIDKMLTMEHVADVAQFVSKHFPNFGDADGLNSVALLTQGERYVAEEYFKQAAALIGCDVSSLTDSQRLRLQQAFQFAQGDILRAEYSVWDESAASWYQGALQEYIWSDADMPAVTSQKIIEYAKSRFPMVLQSHLQGLAGLIDTAFETIGENPKLRELVGGTDSLTARYEKFLIITSDKTTLNENERLWHDFDYEYKFENWESIGPNDAVENFRRIWALKRAVFQDDSHDLFSQSNFFYEITVHVWPEVSRRFSQVVREIELERYADALKTAKDCVRWLLTIVEKLAPLFREEFQPQETSLVQLPTSLVQIHRSSGSAQSSVGSIEPSTRIQSLLAQAQQRAMASNNEESGVHQKYNVNSDEIASALNMAKEQAISAMQATDSAFGVSFKNSKHASLLSNAKSDYSRLVSSAASALAGVWQSATDDESSARSAISSLSSAIDGTELLDRVNHLGGKLPMAEHRTDVQPFKYETKEWKLGVVKRAESNKNGFSWVHVEELGTKKIILVNVLVPVTQSDKEYKFFQHAPQIRLALSSNNPAEKQTSFIQTLRDRRAEAEDARLFKSGMDLGLASAFLQYGQTKFGVCKCNPGSTGPNCGVYLNGNDDPNSGKMKAGIIVLIVGCSLALVIALIVLFFCWNNRRQNKRFRDAERKQIEANNQPVKYRPDHTRVDPSSNVIESRVYDPPPPPPAEEPEQAVNPNIPGNIQQDQIIEDPIVVENFGIYEGYNSKIEQILEDGANIPSQASRPGRPKRKAKAKASPQTSNAVANQSPHVNNVNNVASNNEVDNTEGI